MGYICHMHLVASNYWVHHDNMYNQDHHHISDLICRILNSRCRYYNHLYSTGTHYLNHNKKYYLPLRHIGHKIYVKSIE